MNAGSFIAKKRSPLPLLSPSTASTHALSSSLNWIYNLQPLLLNPRYRSMAVTVKNKKKEKLPHPNAFSPKHNNSILSTLFVCFFPTNASNEMIVLIYVRLLAGKEESDSHKPASRRLKSLGGVQGLLLLLLHRPTSEILQIRFQTTAIKPVSQ